jgi:hypothetical protein
MVTRTTSFNGAMPVKAWRVTMVGFYIIVRIVLQWGHERWRMDR